MKSTASEPGLSASARIVFLVPKFSHHTPAILNLHCVPVPYRIQFKTLQPVNWALCLPKQASKVQESGSYNIISKTSCEFKVPKTKYKTLENRAFARVGPSVWNTQKWLDHLLLMTSYLVTICIETDHHWTCLKMRARDKRTVTENISCWWFIVQEKLWKNSQGGC